MKPLLVVTELTIRDMAASPQITENFSLFRGVTTVTRTKCCGSKDTWQVPDPNEVKRRILQLPPADLQRLKTTLQAAKLRIVLAGDAGKVQISTL